MTKKYEVDPKLDLVLERTIDVPRSLVWKVWTEPEHLMKWFTPVPWETVSCEIDLRPGGIFATTMRSPEGDEMPASAGCYLEVVENEKLVFTDGLGPNYRPKGEGFMTAILYLEDAGEGTKYTAIAIHKDPEDKKKHEAMGFYDGWGTVVEQMVEYIKTNLS